MKPTAPPYSNRELSWLEYNQRFLDEACDTSLPLLERLRSLALTALHLDEFFLVRVGVLPGTGGTRLSHSRRVGPIPGRAAAGDWRAHSPHDR